jgi:hypothetical protein
VNRRSGGGEGWRSAVERFWILWAEMARSQLARGSWTPSVGEVARLVWGFVIDASEAHRRVRTRFLEMQIDLAEERIAALAARRGEGVERASGEARGEDEGRADDADHGEAGELRAPESSFGALQ